MDIKKEVEKIKASAGSARLPKVLRLPPETKEKPNV